MKILFLNVLFRTSKNICFFLVITSYRKKNLTSDVGTTWNLFKKGSVHWFNCTSFICDSVNFCSTTIYSSQLTSKNIFFVTDKGILRSDLTKMTPQSVCFNCISFDYITYHSYFNNFMSNRSRFC